MPHILITSASVVAVLFPAVAVTAQSLPNIEDKEIIVTAERSVTTTTYSAAKTELAIVRTPQAVSVVDEAFIRSLNLRTVSEALNYTSGVRSQAFGSDTRLEYYQLRGFQSENLFKDGLLLYNGGAFLSWTTPAEGISRLDVLKGPSSALYGGGSAGGLVNIISKAPVHQPILQVQAGADEYGSIYGSVDINRPLSDTISARAAGLIRRGDTQVELAEDNRSYAALSIGWQPQPNTELVIRASYTGDRSNRPTGFLPYEGFVTPLPDGRTIPVDLFVSEPDSDRYDRDQYEVSYTLKAQINPHVGFSSNSRYGRINLVYSGLFGSFRGNPGLVDGRVVLNRGNSRLDANLDNFATYNHLTYQFGTSILEHEMLAGVDYNHTRFSNVQQFGAAPALDIFNPQYGAQLPPFFTTIMSGQKLDQTGIYVQDTIRLKGFTALFSARQDWIAATSTGSGPVQRTTSKRSTYRAGISYLTTSGFAPYVSRATSFSPVIGVEQATSKAYRPETGSAWEVGIKYQRNDIPIQATAALFSIIRDGVLVANPQPGFPRNQNQSGKQRSRGGEVEVQTRPLKGLNITAALTAFDIDIIDGTDAEIAQTPRATPQFISSLFADYRFGAGSPLAGLGIGAGVRHTGKSYADIANELAVPAATIFDAALNYNLGRFRLSANISNIFDKEYVAACPGPGTCYAANLRRATLSLAYKLGAQK